MAFLSKKYIWILWLGLACACGSARAQKLDSMMQIYSEHFPQEKIHVHFDKQIYTAGESVWFKAYIFEGTEPSTISKNFYAELFDDKGVIIQRRTAPIYESCAAGNFEIPAASKSGHFHFRAYTGWMLNFDSAFYYEKDIKVLVSKPDSSAKPVPANQFLKFFPEGGDLIAGLENTVAFKATDALGKPIAIHGILKDASGKEVLDFTSMHDGMGKFMVIPDSKDVFTAEWKDDKGSVYKADFPPVKSEGIVLRVLAARNKAIFSIAKNSGSSKAFDRLTVIGHMNQQMVYKAQVNLESSAMSGGSIPTDQLPSGILQITVFNQQNMPMAERIVFVNNHEYGASAAVNIETKSLAKRGINTINVEIPDTIRANLSIAVTDFEADGNKKDDENIISRLLLTSDIRGLVYQPSYYFSNDSDSTRTHLDLVMLTHGWRRFNWDWLAAGRKPVIKYPLQEFLAINVDVFGVDASHIASKEAMNVILRKKDSSVQMLEIPRLKGTKFGQDGLVFYDTAKGYYQFNVSRNLSNESALVFNNGLYNGVKLSKPTLTTFTGWTAEDSGFLRKNRYVVEEAIKIKPDLDKRVQTLAAVTVKARQKTTTQKLDEQYATGLFAGGDAYSFNLLDDPLAVAFPDIFSYLANKVGGLQITFDATGQPVVMWRGVPTTIYLDEMKLPGSSIKSMTTPTNIAYVKVFRPGTMMMSGGGAGGAIAIYTRKGADKVPDPSIKGLDQTRIIGYSPIKQFYSPDYLHQTEISDVEDIRTTLYWNPYLFLDKNSKRISVDFYNSDVARKFRVILEGINGEGKLIRVEKIIQ